MLLAVAIWTIASLSHAWMTTFLGFALARAVLGLGEGATFPGGLRTAVETLPARQARARHRALVQRRHDRRGDDAAAARTAGPAVRVADGVSGDRSARRHVARHLGGHRAPAVPAGRAAHGRRRWRGRTCSERRVWALIFSYALPAISPGPILTILSLYLESGLELSQAELNQLVWIPPATWGIGYFFWGWVADRFASSNRRPVGPVPAAHGGVAHARHR